MRGVSPSARKIGTTLTVVIDNGFAPSDVVRVHVGCRSHHVVGRPGFGGSVIGEGAGAQHDAPLFVSIPVGAACSILTDIATRNA